jgi:predicted phage tail protein
LSNNSNSQVIDLTNLKVTTFTPTTDLTPATYTAWVRAFDTAGFAGVWSGALSFVVAAPDAPALTAPLGETTNNLPTFTWNAVTAAATYELWVNNISTGASQVIHQTAITATSFAATTALPVGTYAVWLRSINTAGQPGPWSAPSVFNLTALLTPTLSSGSGELATTQPTFIWGTVPGATNYEVWVNNNANPQTPAIDAQVPAPAAGNTVQFTPPLGLPVGRFTGWVRASAGGAQAQIAAASTRAVQTAAAQTATFSQWSAPWNFTIVNLPTPVITGPVGSTTATKPSITWGAVTGALQYQIWIDNETTGVSGFLVRNNLATNSFIPPSNLIVGTYRVWVQAYKVGGAASPWSAPFDFTVAPPPAPVPTFAANAAVPAILWNATAGADHYQIWISNANTGPNPVINQTLTETTFATNVLGKGTFDIWVKAYNSNDEAGNWSSVLQITL